MLAPTARSLFLRAPLVQARAPTALASIRALHSHGSLPASSLPKATAKRTVTTSAPTPLERNEPRRVDRVPWPPKLRASLSLALPPSSSSRRSADSRAPATGNTAWKDRKSAFTEIAPVYIWPGVVSFLSLPLPLPLLASAPDALSFLRTGLLLRPRDHLLLPLDGQGRASSSPSRSEPD